MATLTQSKYSEFSDPRLVAVYDTVNPLGAEASFYLNLAKDLGVQKLIDVGCGTGLLSYEFIKRGIKVIGVDPYLPMLNKAKERYQGNLAVWVHGNSDRLKNEQADLAIMTGHVAQFYLNDEDWLKNLQTLHKFLKPNGYISFESRNPMVLPFQNWPTFTAHRKLTDSTIGAIEWWVENLEFKNNCAQYEIHYLFIESEQELVSKNELIFRTEEEIALSLINSGFEVKDIFGDWDRSLLKKDSEEMIFVAQKSQLE